MRRKGLQDEYTYHTTHTHTHTSPHTHRSPWRQDQPPVLSPAAGLPGALLTVELWLSTPPPSVFIPLLPPRAQLLSLHTLPRRRELQCQQE